ncbi:hypothetical protein Dda_5666 [Drechslerella dactyloides]|uniref:Uncharacterized protein n=1 Tax=Drechslerella dactyloides TaxID=74499 RepID=A0AAD6NHR6_DREDA|nr:hypothetical protein Dda_5666 [Drechslerella dactyloides]
MLQDDWLARISVASAVAASELARVRDPSAPVPAILLATASTTASSACSQDTKTRLRKRGTLAGAAYCPPLAAAKPKHTLSPSPNGCQQPRTAPPAISSGIPRPPVEQERQRLRDCAKRNSNGGRSAGSKRGSSDSRNSRNICMRGRSCRITKSSGSNGSKNGNGRMSKRGAGYAIHLSSMIKITRGATLRPQISEAPE